jgi:hypothetical protein
MSAIENRPKSIIKHFFFVETIVFFSLKQINMIITSDLISYNFIFTLFVISRGLGIFQLFVNVTEYEGSRRFMNKQYSIWEKRKHINNIAYTNNIAIYIILH